MATQLSNAQLHAANATLEASARFHLELLDAVEQAVVATDRLGRVAYWNRAAQQLWGWSALEANGLPLTNFVSGTGVGEQAACHRDGHRIPVEVTTTSVPGDADHPRTILVFNDLSERRAASQALARLQRVVDSNIVGIVIFDSGGKVIEANQYYLDLLQVSREETHNGSIHWTDATPPEYMAPYRHALEEMRERGVCTPYEKEYVRRDGTRIWVVVVDTILPGPGDEYAAVVLDITDRKRAQADLAHQALHDGLTGLPNRRLLHTRLQQMLPVTDDHEHECSPHALLLLDLDRFKEVNDTLGHQVGDVLLQQIGERLQTVVRDSDLVARLGGDEFAMLLPGADEARAAQVAETVQSVLQPPFLLEGQPIAVDASIGIALAPLHGQDANTLMRRADVAMYQAKRSGTGVAQYSATDDQHSPDRLALLGELRSAIDHDELRLYYQPKLDLRDGTLAGVEALVRWQHPQRGFLAPAEFILLAEQSGLIYPITRWVLEAALTQHEVWRRQGLNIPVAVNLSRRTLHDPLLPAMISHALEQSGAAPAGLVLEITESSLMADPVRARENLRLLRGLGVRMSIDDFGTGYSSLASLKNLPVDELKIDQSFVQTMATDSSSRAIVRAIIDLADALNLRVVAEGVEDRATWDLLAGLGCDVAQGYLLSRPISAADLELLIARSGASWLAMTGSSHVDDPLHDRIRARGAHLTAEEEFMARQQAEAALHASEERNRVALQAAGVGTWDWDASRDILTWSEEMQALSGLAGHTFAGTLAALKHTILADDWSGLIDELQLATREQRDWVATYRTVWPDGSLHWLETTGRGLYSVEGTLQRVTGTSMDITERRRTEAALRTSEGRYRTLFEYAPDGILIADSQSYYVDANASMCRMLGYSRDELIGLHATDIVLPTEVKYIGPALTAVSATSDYHRRWQFRRKDGSAFAAEVMVTTIPDGKLLAMIRQVADNCSGAKEWQIVADTLPDHRTPVGVGESIVEEPGARLRA